MIRIGSPFIEKREGRIYLVSNVLNEGENRNHELWFSVEKDYEEFLVSEVADPFVVALALRAVVSKQDIVVDAPLSERLLHNLNNSVFFALSKCCLSNKNTLGQEIFQPSVTCRNSLSLRFGATGVGTGCSLGVDSLSILKEYYLDHSSYKYPSYRITHLACFNVGAFGSFNTDSTRESFFREVMRMKDFGDTIGLPVVAVDSNIHTFFPEVDFNWSHTYLNMGCVLALQKLWGRYLYASGYSLGCFEWDIHDSAKYEPFLLPGLSTENTELVSVDMDKTRSEKLLLIADDPLVQNNLTVCLKEQRINNGRIQRCDVSDSVNCGVCEKCLRTMLQLDIYDKLCYFKRVFDLSKWDVNKVSFVRKVVMNKDHNYMYADIYRTLLNSKYADLLFQEQSSLSTKSGNVTRGQKVLRRIRNSVKSLFLNK